MLTEQNNPNTTDIDRLSTAEIVRRINAEDQTVAPAVEAVLPRIAEAVDAIAGRLANGGRLFYVGAGTSGRLGMLDAVECIPTFNSSPETIQAVIAGGNDALIRAIEGAEDDRSAGAANLKARQLAAGDAVIGIAASGRTPYVLGAMDYAREVGALTLGLTCNVPAPLLDAAAIPIGVPVGAEVIAGSTRMKAGTAQKLVLNMISTAVMIKLGKVYGNLMVDVQVTNNKLAQRARQIVAHLTGLDEEAAADLLTRANNQVKLAVIMHYRGVDAGIAAQLLARHGGFLRDVIDEA